MGVPPTPYDPNAAASGGASTTSTIDIWGLGPYGEAPIIIGAATRPQSGFGGYSKLPGYDQDKSAGPVRAGDGLAVTDTLAKVLKEFSAMAYSPQTAPEFLKWQRQLYTAGLYGSKKPSEVAWGSWDDDTYLAFKTALTKVAQSNEAGAPISFDEYLTKLGADKQRAAKELSQQDPTIREHANPQVVAGVLQQAAQAAFGRNLSKDEVDHFVSEYRAAEDSYYHTAESAQATPGVHDLTKPDVQAQAQGFVNQHHAAEAGGASMAGYFGEIERLINGGA